MPAYLPHRSTPTNNHRCVHPAVANVPSTKVDGNAKVRTNLKWLCPGDTCLWSSCSQAERCESRKTSSVIARSQPSVRSGSTVYPRCSANSRLEGRDQIPGLLFWNTNGTVRLPETRSKLGPMLIERCSPGTSLHLESEARQDESRSLPFRVHLKTFPGYWHKLPRYKGGVKAL